MNISGSTISYGNILYQQTRKFSDGNSQLDSAIDPFRLIEDELSSLCDDINKVSVSIYARFKYISCDNIKLHVLISNNSSLITSIQSYYQFSSKLMELANNVCYQCLNYLSNLARGITFSFNRQD